MCWENLDHYLSMKFLSKSNPGCCQNKGFIYGTKWVIVTEHRTKVLLSLFISSCSLRGKHLLHSTWFSSGRQIHVTSSSQHLRWILPRALVLWLHKTYCTWGLPAGLRWVRNCTEKSKKADFSNLAPRQPHIQWRFSSILTCYSYASKTPGSCLLRAGLSEVILHITRF